MDPTPLGHRRVLDDFLTVDRIHLAAPDGEAFSRTVIRHHGSVVVVPWDGERVHLVSQYRAPVGARVLELPAGTLAEGEDPLEAAARELREETGFVAARSRLLHSVYASPGYTSELAHVVLAEVLTPGDPEPHGPEERFATQVALTIAEVQERLADIDDATTLIGLYALLAEVGE